MEKKVVFDFFFRILQFLFSMFFVVGSLRWGLSFVKKKKNQSKWQASTNRECIPFKKKKQTKKQKGPTQEDLKGGSSHFFLFLF